MNTLSIRISEKARALLDRHCHGTRHGELIPELILAVDPEIPSKQRCVIGYHDRKVWDDAPPEWRYLIDGKEFLISNPAPALMTLIQDTVLDVDADGRYAFRCAN